MRRTVRLLCILCPLGSSAAWAQESPTVEIFRVALQDVVTVAVDRGETIEVARARLARAEAEQEVARAGYWPTVAAATSYQRTFASQFDALSEGPSGPDSPLGSLPFGRDNTWQVGLVASQDVWNGGATRARTRLAAASLDNAELAVTQSRAEVALDAAGAWFDAQLTDQLVAIAAASAEAAQRTLELTELGFEVGQRPEFDVLRARVEVENQRVTLIRQTRLRDIAYLRLRQLLDLPPDAVIELVPETVDVTPAATEVVEVEPDDARVPVQQAESALEIAQASVAIARAQRLPAVGIDATMGWFAYPETLLPPIKEGVWNDDINASIALQVPLFTGGRVRGGISAARADVAQAEAQLDLVRELAALDQADAETALAAARAQWEATAGAVDQAEQAYTIAEVRFREGLSTQVELTDTRLSLRQAQANRAIAARDLELARLRLALLPALPLNAGSGFAPATAGSPTTGTATTGAAGAPTTGAQTTGASTLGAPATGAPASF